MKKIITILLTFITFYANAQDFSTILFIGRGNGFSYDIYINQQPIGTVKGKQVLEYKIYSEGSITIDVVWSGKKTTEIMGIEHGKTYYFECFGTDDREVGKMKAKALLRENTSTIQAEEGKVNVPIKAPVTETSNSGTRQGTCFLVNRKGYVITSYHLIRQAKTIQVKGIAGDFSTLYGADVIAYDVDMDMAVLKIKNPMLSFDSIPYRFSSGTNAQGTKSFVPGYPLTAASGDSMTVTEGVISATTGRAGTISEYQFSQALQPGSSGSPLFNEKGEILGLINTNLKEAAGSSYAIKASYIQAFLMSADVSMEMSSSNIDLPGIAKLKNFIFIVKAE